MKKFGLVLGILVALFALFAISSSAAILRDTQHALLSVPKGQNIAQPVWQAYSTDFTVVNSYQSTTPARSALNSSLSVSTPDNNAFYQGTYVTAFPIQTEYMVLYGGGLFGDANGTLEVSSLYPYVHIVLDLGGSTAPYTTSAMWLSQFRVRIVDRDNETWEFPFYADASRNLLYCDVPLNMEGVKLGGISIWCLRPSYATDAQISASSLCFNYIWAWFDDVASPSLDLVHSQNGYTSAYLNYYNLVPLGDVSVSDETSYYYDLGYSQGFDIGDRSGYNRGFDAGVDSVTDQTGDPVSIKTAIFAVPNALVHLLRSLFDFEIAGFNLFDALKFLIALLAIAFVARLILRSMV